MVKLVNAVGQSKILRETLILRDVPLDFHTPYTPLTGLDGGARVGKTTVLPRNFEIKGRIYHANDKTQNQTYLDELLLFLTKAPLKVYRLEEQQRYLMAYPQGAPQSWISLGQELEVTLPMLALDPYWYGNQVTETFSVSKTITIPGTAATYPVIVTTEKVASLKVTNNANGDEAEIVGGTSGILTIDSYNMTALCNGTECLTRTKEKWRLNRFALMPGENTITTTQAIQLVYAPRWY